MTYNSAAIPNNFPLHMILFDAIFSQEPQDKVAIRFEQQRISYSELRERTLSVARALSFLNVERGDRVALLLNDSLEFVASFIAISSYGAIAVPVNMGLGFEEQRTILNDCTASVAIAEANLAGVLAAGEQLPSLRTVVVVDREEKSTTETQSAQRRHSDGAAGPRRLWSLEEVLAESVSQATPAFIDPADDQPCCIFYTSGSTGEPKGAVHRQADMFYSNETYCREVLKLRADDRVFSSSRLPFSYGFGNAFCFPLLNGCTTILCREKPNAEVISSVFAEHQPTIFFGVPVIYRLLLDHHRDVARLDFSHLRFCVSAGEALPARLGEEIEAVFGVEVLDGIGSTEMFHMWMSNYQGEVRYGSSGKLIKGYEARLLDPEGKPSPAGAEGNLWVKGASAALGYWNKPEVTAATFVDGWVRTGDLYRQDADGYWYHMGRSDDCFKSSGQWVSPVEVEGALLKHAGVNRIAVVEDFDGNGLPCACAFVIKTNSAADDAWLEEQLKKLAREKLPRFKQPRKYVFVDELPYTATGKIQRFKLRERLKESPRSNVQSPMSATHS
ncbi:MAG TPA: benzoate-CoA ligase family protein [Pyrinomonadaceae bacterium]|nr:benzoate-CoA ligase family protein [Pyrinomonadaceae bacterium]